MHLSKHILALVVLLSLSGFARAWNGVVETTAKTYEVKGRPELILKNSDGNIKLTHGAEGVVQITIIKEVRNAANEEEGKKKAADIHVDLDQSGNQIDVETHWPRNEWLHTSNRAQVTVTYEISAPRMSDIRASVADGSLHANGFDGTMNLSTADGDVSVANLSGTLAISGVDGDVDITDSSGTMALSIVDGKLDATRCSGALTVHAVDGTVHIQEIEGTLDIHASDGKLFVDGVLKTLAASMVDGKMEVRLMSGSTLEKDSSLTSSDGNILLQLPKDLQANLELSTSGGRIDSQLPIEVTGALRGNHLSGKLNKGGHLLTIRTVDGDIHLLE